MKNLPMDLLRAFVTVVEFNSFTKAGELLGRTQPAISLQINRLESMLDEALLVRDGKNLALTIAGETFFDYAKQILSLNDLAVSECTKSTVMGKVRLGIPSEFATILLPKIVGRFAKAYPNVTLEVNCELSKTLLSRSGKAAHDLILALQNNPLEESENLVKTDNLVWVSGSEYNAQKPPPVPLIVAPEGCIYRQRAIRVLNKIKQPWQIVYNIPDLTGIQYAIHEGLGVTVLAKSTVPENLKIIPNSQRYPDLGTVGISLLNVRKNTKNQAIDLLAEFLRTSLA
ncbi:MAG: HTH-type transcriptional regulator YofA [Cellvibrionales bacterium UBA7375]|nr:LysR family transcriptional regulator [Gammaproteobacteria bacterium]CAI8157700.1 MAG: HTH-type transcriptional regulator YofA [Cellvibrionales bacterium UBA7375]